jgi:hypothetical protein
MKGGNLSVCWPGESFGGLVQQNKKAKTQVLAFEFTDN